MMLIHLKEFVIIITVSSCSLLVCLPLPLMWLLTMHLPFMHSTN